MSRDRSLPIFELEEELRAAATSDGARIVVEAPTGSGKSTQVPQFLLDALEKDEGEIYVLQPRRLAARLLANRVASERDSRLGDEIGYQVRFEQAVSDRTRIRFVTEGVLIRRLIEDPQLRGISAVVLDEFHERHFFGDVSLARCREVQRDSRSDLRIVVMSATLEAESLTEFLGEGCRHLVSRGRTFPVDISHHPQRERHKGQLWDHIARTIRDHLREHGVDGHILIFLPGRYEIQKTAQQLRKSSWSSGFEIHELYGELSPEKQDAAVSPSESPKIVVTTNVAETSITIEGVRLVVDSGLERRAAFDHRRGITTLHIEKISRASADQRAGRAGRTGPGHAIRLWSERDHEAREKSTPAEIRRMDLTEAVLILASSGIRDIRRFPWFEPPDSDALDEAIERLRILGALDSDERITPLGDAISRLPLPPRLGRIIFEAHRRDCLETVALIAALTQARPLFPTRKQNPEQLEPGDFAEAADLSDFQPLLRAWRQMKENRFRRDLGQRLGIRSGPAREVDRIASQILRIASRWKADRDSSSDTGSISEDETLARVLLTGYSDRIAIRSSPTSLSCAVIGGRRGEIEKDSIASDPSAHLFLAAEMIEVEGRDLTVKLRLCTLLEEAWLRDAFPGDFHETEGAVYDETHRRVEARRERRFRDLVLESRASDQIPTREAAGLLAERVLSGDLVLKKWDDKVENWIARVNLVAGNCPNYEIPPIDTDARQLLVEQVCEGATRYKEIKDRPVWPALQDWIPAHLAPALDHLAPERIHLSNGREARVRYHEEGKPRISVLIQQIFGLRDQPTVCDGRVPVVVEILAPNHRPIQVTENLSGFWEGSYPAVRAQLRGRYPKHEWPEFE